jgi:hypothetical protein
MEKLMKETNLLDSSLSLDIDHAVSKEEYIQNVVTLLQPILNQRFDNTTKQRIRVYHDRVNFSCPYCGDSMKNIHAKRGNIILEGKFKNHYKCFNCNEFRRVDWFFTDWKVTLKLDVINYIASTITDFSTTSNSKYDVSLLLDVDTIEMYAIDRSELISKFGLMEVKETSIWSWLNNRLQYDASKFLWSPKGFLLILNNTPSGKVIGAQMRLFNVKKNNYRTIKLSKLYQLLKKDASEIPEEIDDISILFGIFNINFNKPIVLFEGPFDSFLYKNSIANCGANKAFPLDIPVKLFYDYDDTGIKKTIQAINEQKYVFLWSKFAKEMELPYRDKWDLNDCLLFFKKNNIKPPNFENYFSDDPLDIMDV